MMELSKHRRPKENVLILLSVQGSCHQVGQQCICIDLSYQSINQSITTISPDQLTLLKQPALVHHDFVPVLLHVSVLTRDHSRLLGRDDSASDRGFPRNHPCPRTHENYILVHYLCETSRSLGRGSVAEMAIVRIMKSSSPSVEFTSSLTSELA